LIDPALMIKSRMYAALSATNEAILRTRAPEELFQRVCDAVVHGGGFKTAGAMLPDEDGWLRMVAVAGYHGRQPISTIRISVKADSDRGQGLAGTAFRTGQPAVSNDYRNDFQNDERFRPFREDEKQTIYGAAAAVPILKGGTSIGVFLFYVEEAHSLNRETIGLLERLVENVSFALGNFELEAERKRVERASRRVSDMFAALSATNTAILRARNMDEMFQLVCDSVAKGGRSLGAAAIFMKQPDSPWLKLAAASGNAVGEIEKMPLSLDPDDKYGHGLHGPAFREQKLFISYDTAADERTQPWVVPGTAPHGCAATPLIKGGESVGILFFFFGRTSGREDEGIRQLMADIAENVSFGLALFEREQQQQRLSRMFAALSATNEAIMRAKSRQELYQMVCEAAVTGAKFTSTTILLAEPGDDYFRLAATAGPNVGIIQSRKYSPRADLPEGRGLTGTAYRTGKPSVSNDTRASEKAVQWPYPVEQRSSKAGAALPLFSQKGTVGVLLFMAAEKGAFTDEFVELLQRLAENVSYALETFDRADDQRAAEKRIEYLATHDSLTGLPNRVMFNQLLEQSIKSAKRGAAKCAVLFIDLDRFKIINDSLGHAAGDMLLVEIAGRLKACLRESDVVARLGGDEFVVILNDVRDRETVEAVGRKILASLLPSLNLAGHECRTTGSIGIAMYPDHGSDAHTLTKNADIAMYVAKEDGKNDLRFFSSDIKSQSIERLMLETNLRHALELNQLTLHYQPKLDVATEIINGVEALLRWNHPDLGSLSPMKFIPLAEETGLIIPIGRWVLRTACAQNMEWQRLGLPVITMAINLSPRQFTDENLLNDIDDVLRETAMPPHLLQLEITESMVMQNVERGIKLLDAIQSRGVRLAIDDFGTGYSSMSLMKQFPIDTIKIDRSFVRDLAENEEDRAIATAIIAMGKALGLTVVAEGVETAEQDAFLRRRDCDELQGYLFSKPVPADQIPPMLMPQIASPSLQPRRGVSMRNGSREPVANNE
jgi:diguanylate cyclase (GGDEF)-like protein